MKINFDKLFELLNTEVFQKKLKKVNFLIAVVSIIYIIIIFISNNENISGISEINPLELIFLVIIYFIVGITWVKFSTKNNSVEGKSIFFDWSFSNIGKYFPGGIGLISIRLNQEGNDDKSKKILFGLLEEQLLVPLLSLPVLLFVALFLDQRYIYVSIILTQIAFVYLFKVIYFKNKKIKETSILNFSNYLIFSILSTNFLTFYIFYNLGYENFLRQGIYYLIASYIGLLFVGVPAGIGVREAIFIFLLGTDISISQEVTTLLYIRILYLIVDTVYGVAGFIYKSKK